MAYPAAIDVNIANTALARLSEKAIVTFADNTPAARAISRVYPQARNLMFAAVDWSFATARVALTNRQTGSFPWAYEYDLPTTGVARCRLLLPAVASADMIGLDPVPFEEGVSFRSGAFVPVIRCDPSAATLVYTALLVDQPELWEPGFVSALSVQLAAEIAMPVTGNAQLAQAMRQEAAQAVQALGPQSQAQAVTRQQRGPSTTTAARG